MSLSFPPDFLAGRYRAVVERVALGADSTEGDLAGLIGALSFLGMMDEAEACFAMLRRRAAPSPAALCVSRFFLGTGFTRKSEYARARRYFARNEKSSGATPLERFYILQGRVFYRYYTGRFRGALRWAAKARSLALRSNDLFALALATDAYGQCRVVAGEVHHGLRLLGEASELARRMGNESVANSIAVSLELHDAEFGLSGERGLTRLERRLTAVGTEDNYSQANVGLELARQYTRRGRFAAAAQVLETVAPHVYGQQNRRQEITLNLRLAELAYQKGDLFGARHFLRFLDRLLHREADSTFELASLGLGTKIALAEGRGEEAEALRLRGLELAREFGTSRDDNLQVRLGSLPPSRENREDRVHCVLQSARLLAGLPEKLRPLLEQDLLVEASLLAGLASARPGVAVLPQGLGVLTRDAGGVRWNPVPLSSLSAKLLRRLAAGRCDKAALVESVWGYRYAPRHDPLVYSALSLLRKALGTESAAWLQANEEGYTFAAAVSWLAAGEAPAESPRAVPAFAASSAAHLSPLNHRQIEVLEWMREKRFLAVGDCRERFDVSEATSLRDLDGLRRMGLVVRRGRARATRYTLPEENESGALIS